MKFWGSALFMAAALSVFLSCAGGPDAYAPIDAGVRAGSYENALASLDDEKGPAQKRIYTSKNKILLYLDRGMIKHYAGLYEESSEDLEEAERLIEEAFTKSITQEIGSYIVNDNARDYAGEDYEDIYINVFNALNYYHQGDLEGALVEIRHLNEKLRHLSDKYEAAIEKVLDSNRQIDPRQLPVEAARFSNSALARYLGVLFYRGSGNQDDARIDWDELKEAYERAPGVYTRQVPASAGEELSIPPETGRLNVIAFTGLSPVKEEENILIPLPLPYPNNSTRLALPKMSDRASAVQWAEVSLEGGVKFRLELLEDMGAVARETFKARYGLTVLKTTARTITKAAASAGLARVASSEKNGKGGDGLGALVGLLGRIATEISEQADIRLSRYFPRYALVGGINLEPGTYSLKIDYYGAGGLVHSERRENVPVRENTLNLMEFVCLK
jgi:hypothetical protein